MKQPFSVILLFVLISISAQTTLTKDTSFSFEFPDEGNQVIFKLYPYHPNAFPEQVKLAPDNSIYSIGKRTTNQTITKVVLFKSNPDGSLDLSFSDPNSTGGYIYLPFEDGEEFHIYATYFIVQNSGKVILVKSDQDGTESQAYRYELDGSLDLTFGNNGVLSGLGGIVDAWSKSFVQLEDDSFLDIQQNLLVKYTADGQKDLSYGTNGEIAFSSGNEMINFGVWGDYIYRSQNNSTLLSYFNYKNPSDASTIEMTPNGNTNFTINNRKLGINEEGEIFGPGLELFFSSPQPSGALFVLNNDLSYNNNFNGDGFVALSPPIKDIIYTSNQYYILDDGAIMTYDSNGVQQKINNELRFRDSEWEDIWPMVEESGGLLFGKNDYLLVKYEGSLYKFNITNSTPTREATLWNGSVWDNGLPTQEKEAIIDGALTLDSHLEAFNLKITANGMLDIPSGINVTIQNEIFNHYGDLTLHDGANLLQINDYALAHGYGKIHKYSQPMKRLDYTMWSSSVSRQELQAFSPETLSNRIYTYETDEITEAVGGAYVSIDATADFVSGKGYLFRAPNNWPATSTSFEGIFSGYINSGFFTTYTYNNGFTSIGNPYPSNLDADLFLQANPTISALYFWTNPVAGSTGNNYATYTSMGGVASGNSTVVPNRIISVAQGFIVDNKTSTWSNVVFNNSMRVAGSANFFRTSETERHRIWLNLNNEENENLSQTLVGYMTGATNEIDAQIDGKMFGNEGSTLYNIIGEESFAIQGRALPFETSDVVALGFRAAEAGKFAISLSNFDGLFSEGEVTVYLKDNVLNITHNLMESDYSFESAAGEFKTRFEIVYETQEIMGTEDLTSNSVQIYTSNDQILVSSKSEKILSVELFDLSGRSIFRNEKVNSNHYEFKSSSKGVLVVKVQTYSGGFITRKIINK